MGWYIEVYIYFLALVLGSPLKLLLARPVYNYIYTHAKPPIFCVFFPKIYFREKFLKCLLYPPPDLCLTC